MKKAAAAVPLAKLSRLQASLLPLFSLPFNKKMSVVRSVNLKLIINLVLFYFQVRVGVDTLWHACAD